MARLTSFITIGLLVFFVCEVFSVPDDEHAQGGDGSNVGSIGVDGTTQSCTLKPCLPGIVPKYLSCCKNYKCNDKDHCVKSSEVEI